MQKTIKDGLIRELDTSIQLFKDSLTNEINADLSATTKRIEESFRSARKEELTAITKSITLSSITLKEEFTTMARRIEQSFKNAIQ